MMDVRIGRVMKGKGKKEKVRGARPRYITYSFWE